MVGAVIVGAGEGRRMGATVRKQFTKVGGKPIIAYTLEMFENSPLIDHIVAVVPKDALDWTKEEVADAYGFRKIRAIVPGGESRQESVLNGLKALKDKTEIVVIHDAVRPLVSETLIRRVIDAARKTGAAITAIPARDTVKQVESGQIVGTLDRRLLWFAQTPQSFRYNIILDAHRRALEDRLQVTDDASLVENYGAKVTVAVGSYSNLKITSPEDMPLFEYFLRQDNRARLHASQRKSAQGRPARRRGPQRRGAQKGGPKRKAPQQAASQQSGPQRKDQQPKDAQRRRPRQRQSRGRRQKSRRR
jgi:2-C-methyl-D-erythritol 4-phosphate cytidylyltransferase